MLVASEKPPVELEDATIDGLLANEVPLTSGVHGDDEDLLAAQAKVRKAQKDALDGPPTKRCKTKVSPVGKGKAKAKAKPRSSTDDQPVVKNGAPADHQVVEENGAPADQPVVVENGAPADQPVVEQNGAPAEQVVENGAPAEQVVENGAPAEQVVVENGAPAEQVVVEQNGAPAEQVVEQNGAPAEQVVEQNAADEEQEVPLLIAAEVPLPRGHPATRPYLKKSYTLKYEGPGADRKNQSSIAILWFKGEIYVNRVMNVEAANRASINVNKKKGSTISVKKRGWLSALLTAKLLAGWPRDDDRM
ncbi:unnamed protein product [Symbiodinium microadriaticum]|nr:unnamed protein product [Symbiodinium sp. KB8]CAE7213312.1 unnamed protein product [Symbiodinium microadriaticum]